MNCKECGSKAKKFGKDRNGTQRFRCTKCGKTFLGERKKMFANMTLDDDRILLCLQLLVEGNSISSTCRITEVDKKTVLKLLLNAGAHCERLSEEIIKNVSVADVQCDEIWGFVGKKEKTKKSQGKSNCSEGDAYTFSAIERNSKLILCWHLGRRDTIDTYRFTEKLERATSGNFQVTTDGFPPYKDAMSMTLGARVDFAQLIKVYRATRAGEQRYSPAEVVEAIPVVVYGNPDEKKICTSHIERSNLTTRMSMRRMTRLTNAFSKKWIMLKAALGLHFAYYNFCRIHQTLKVTPAMEAGITDHVWSLRELVEKS